MVIATAKTLTEKILSHRRQDNLSAGEVKAALEYIDKYWPKLTRYHPKDDDTLLGLPHPYLVPAYEQGHEFDYNELYYWDSYFMVQGMLDKQNEKLVTGILENFLKMLDRFKIIPNGSRTYLMGRSQPPFLTSFILDVYNAYGKDRKWLENAMKKAEGEYHHVWMGTHKPNARLVHKGLSRYYDINYLHDLAEAESGWDMTTRFGHKCMNYLPVDLNALLYKYEADFAYTAELLGKKKEAEKWEKAARARKRDMNSLMWSELKGLYYDYNFVKEERGGVSSLAAYYPLWAGMVDEHQAQRLVSSLRKFENQGGLATTDTMALGKLVPGSMPTQWAYPNGWAPLHFIAIKGLQRYGYHEDAERIAMKWLRTNLDWFNKHGVFLEKYNVVQPHKPPVKGVYPSQTGFGWTNAVFSRLCQEFIKEV
jgi:alpha,alpha-trehalase